MGRELNMRTAVVGIGGAGCNIVSDIYWNEPSLDTVAITTDKDALETVDADRKLFICKSVTQGLGTNGDSLLGRKCAQAHMEEIREALSDYDVVYIVAGMGGGTGTGAAPVVTEIAQELGLIVSAILITPFSFETARTSAARDGIARMRSVCRMNTVIDNDMILRKYPDLTMEEAFHDVNWRITSHIMKHRNKISRSFLEQLSEAVVKADDSASIPISSVKGMASL